MLRGAARGVLGGAVGTAAMALAAHRRRRRFTRRHGVTPEDAGVVLDYDDSEHVVIAASVLTRHVIGWAPRSPQERQALFWLVHWGYGSAVGAGHVALQHVLGREPRPGLAFFAASQVMALGLFPVLGETPPPWRWERRLVVTSFVQHAIYAGVVAAANTATAPPAPTARLVRLARGARLAPLGRRAPR
ncbi:hypothetical protein [Actinomycetospora succinea]|uniref:hypothetical protein n=1 Tax=Actinomycetospora succinea TaxID=663603 RepID=UPI00105BC8F0|nr:hypothetical protein [Actinomycetospora succinea]